MQPRNDQDLRQIARELRREVIDLSYRSKSGHIGSSLSCVDLLVALYERFLVIDPSNRLDPGRDRFLMSKGHACTPFYGCLARAGLLPRAILEAYGQDGGVLGHHPHRAPEMGIEISTGSLGHALSVGCGLAFGAKLTSARFRTVVLMSDGEQQEGTVWEAAMFAARHRLDNLLAVVDFNKMQALGNVSEIIELEPLHERWRSFGWAVRRINGHDFDEIVPALGAFPFEPGKPSLIVADTVKGKGVSFMEDSLLWHYRCPDPDEYAAATAELNDA